MVRNGGLWSIIIYAFVHQYLSRITILGTIWSSYQIEVIVYFWRWWSCKRVNLISMNNVVSFEAIGQLPTHCSLLWSSSPWWWHLKWQWLPCFRRWVCTWHGSGSKQTLQSLHNKRCTLLSMLTTIRPISRSNFGVWQVGDWINAPKVLAHCRPFD
jgi:hypothetical protein